MIHISSGTFIYKIYIHEVFCCYVLLLNGLRCWPLGAIGDVDGDGQLDMVASFTLEGTIMDEEGYAISSIMEMRLAKIDINSMMTESHATPLNITLKNIKEEKSEGTKHLTDISFLPYSQQRWTEYMGTQMDSMYHAEGH